MNKNLIIAAVAAVAVVIVLWASFIAFSDNEDGPVEHQIAGEWSLVTVYEGGWMDGVPAYSEDTTQKQHVTITPHEGDFYIFDNGDDKLYCSWDGYKMVTSGLYGESDVIFIMQVPKNDDFMMVSYFHDDNGTIEVYKRDGFVGEFPGLSIPLDLPDVGETLDTFKAKGYTPEGEIDYGTCTLTMKAVDGRMMFYTVDYNEGGFFEYIGIYLGGSVFMSMGLYGDAHVYDMSEYRGDVLYTATYNQNMDSIWVSEFGDESKADYPDKDLEGCSYTGTEDVVMYKNGKVVEERYGTKVSLIVQIQEDALFYISTVDGEGKELAVWIAQMNDLRPVYHYGISVQTSVMYGGVEYHGWYFGYFDTADCNTLAIYGTLTSDDGDFIVISQDYTLDKYL